MGKPEMPNPLKEVPKNIEEYRKVLPGLQQAWEVYHGSKERSKVLEDLRKKHGADDKEITEAKTQAFGKDLMPFQQKKKLTFEKFTVLEQTALRLQLIRRSVEEKTDTKDKDSANLAQRETIWGRYNRLTHRSLETLDRYVVLRSQLEKQYGSKVIDEKAEAGVKKELENLQTAMQERVDIAHGDSKKDVNEADQKIEDILTSIPVTSGELYINLLIRARQENSALQLKGVRTIGEARFKQLPLERALIVNEEYAYMIHEGYGNIDDLQALALLDAGKKYKDKTVTKPSIDTDPVAGRKLDLSQNAIDLHIKSIRNGFREHFQAVVGKDPKDPNLIDITKEMKGEKDWTESKGFGLNNQLRILKMTDKLVTIRGKMRKGVSDAVRYLQFTKPFVKEQPDAEQYNRETLGKVKEAMGLPEDFDFSEAAWKKIKEDPVRWKKFIAAITSMMTIVEREAPKVEAAVATFEQDLAIFDGLVVHARNGALRNLEPDQDFYKRGKVTPADVRELDREMKDDPKAARPKVLAALLLLGPQMGDHWNKYTDTMGTFMDDVLAHHDAKEEKGGRELDAKNKIDVENKGDWWWLLIAAAIGGGAYLYMRSRPAARMRRMEKRLASIEKSLSQQGLNDKEIRELREEKRLLQEESKQLREELKKANEKLSDAESVEDPKLIEPEQPKPVETARPTEVPKDIADKLKNVTDTLKTLERDSGTFRSVEGEKFTCQFDKASGKVAIVGDGGAWRIIIENGVASVTGTPPEGIMDRVVNGIELSEGTERLRARAGIEYTRLNGESVRARTAEPGPIGEALTVPPDRVLPENLARDARNTARMMSALEMTDPKGKTIDRRVYEGMDPKDRAELEEKLKDVSERVERMKPGDVIKIQTSRGEYKIKKPKSRK